MRPAAPVLVRSAIAFVPVAIVVRTDLLGAVPTAAAVPELARAMRILEVGARSTRVAMPKLEMIARAILVAMLRVAVPAPVLRVATLRRVAPFARVPGAATLSQVEVTVAELPVARPTPVEANAGALRRATQWSVEDAPPADRRDARPCLRPRIAARRGLRTASFRSARPRAGPRCRCRRVRSNA